MNKELIQDLVFLLELIDNPIARIKRLREIVSVTNQFDTLFPHDQINYAHFSRFTVTPKTLGLACAKNFLEENKMLYFTKELNNY